MIEQTAAKQALRQEMRRRRKAMPPEEKTAGEQRLCRRFLESSYYRNCRQLFCFVALPQEPETRGILRQICENKAALFQAAFQTDCLDIIPSDEKVEFPWFTVEQDGDADAYCTFISMLCEFAKNQSRINRKPDTSDNPKYTMRCFLIRLGMVGAEFKAARKVILRNLTGNSAFRKVGDTDAVSE